jgi:hypothetical protein
MAFGRAQSETRPWNGHSLLTWLHSGNASSESRRGRAVPNCGLIIRLKARRETVKWVGAVCVLLQNIR